MTDIHVGDKLLYEDGNIVTVGWPFSAAYPYPRIPAGMFVAEDICMTLIDNGSAVFLMRELK